MLEVWKEWTIFDSEYLIGLEVSFAPKKSGGEAELEKQEKGLKALYYEESKQELGEYIAKLEKTEIGEILELASFLGSQK